MKEAQKHRDAFEDYFILKQQGKAVVEAVRLVADKYGVSEGAIYTWKRTFDWDGRESIRAHDVQNKVAEKTNAALAENKAWYLRIIHDSIRKAEEHGVVNIENVRDYDLLVKQALTIQGDDHHDQGETNELLRGLLEAIRQDSESIVGRGVKRSFDDKSESESG
jgi:hypothetical protein